VYPPNPVPELLFACVWTGCQEIDSQRGFLHDLFGKFSTAKSPERESEQLRP
jgi:hypothetical protein